MLKASSIGMQLNAAWCRELFAFRQFAFGVQVTHYFVSGKAVQLEG